MITILRSVCWRVSAAITLALLVAGAAWIVEAAGPGPTASLSVAGSRFVDAAGQGVRLLGVNRSGSEFECIQGGSPGSRGWGLFDGPTDAASAAAIASWHVNAVRIPLNEDCWLGINGVDKRWGGQSYQDQVRQYVQTLRAAGMYVVLDLHWSAPSDIPALSQQPMPDADHAPAFWRSVARTFNSDQGVVFDLYNEPFLYGSYLADSFADPWTCWLHGCELIQYLTGGSPYTRPLRWRAAGMQELVDAVRSTGARNVLMIAGLGWANDLTGWLAHRPNDRTGNIAASWHSYDGQGCSRTQCWGTVIDAIGARVPVVVGETGDSVCSPVAFDRVFLPWADRHGLSYLGWTWNAWGDCQNILIRDYSGTPTPNYGAYFRDHLLHADVHATPRIASPAGLSARADTGTAGAARWWPHRKRAAVLGSAALVALSLLVVPLTMVLRRRRRGLR
jgi:hypothetical protein